MSRINTNVSALIGARVLNNNNNALQKTLERLSTGYRINRGSDDPAGLIASENLRGEIAAIRSSITNAERASGLVSTAEAALAEISDKLVEMQELVAAAANDGGLTQAEIDANQVQVDGIVASINRIAGETSFMGAKLLDGSKGFKTVQDEGNMYNVSVNMAKGVTADKTLTVTVDTAATNAAASAAIAATIDAGGAGQSITYEITGKKGSATVTFGHGTTQTQASAAIGALSSITGVFVSSDHILYSVDATADSFVRVETVTGDNTAGSIVEETQSGTDAAVNIDGSLASVNGYDVSLRTEMLDVSFRMTSTFATTAGNDTIVIEANGGANFMLSPNIGLGGQETIGINGAQAYRLGDGAYGHLSDITTGKAENLTDDPATAQKIVAGAITQVATMRGRLGSFLSGTVDSAVNSLNVALENVSAAESAIRDADFATETAELTRNQVLVQAANSVLSIAAATPQNVLALL